MSAELRALYASRFDLDSNGLIDLTEFTQLVKAYMTDDDFNSCTKS